MNAEVIKILEEAGSQDPNIFKPAEQTLKEWETQRGFYTALLSVFSNQSLPINIRWIAILSIKNGVDRYWRKHAPGEINPDEKEFLRQGLLANFDEPVNQLAVQVSVVIAKIARFDCPREWSLLVPTLLEVIKSENAMIQHRALLTLHQVVKALASKRLPSDQRLFQELSENIFSYILSLWNAHTESFFVLASNGANDHQLHDSLEKALLSLRILRKFIHNGISDPLKNENAIIFLRLIFDRIKTSLECRKNLAARGVQTELCEKFIIHLTKVLLGMIEFHPLCYVDFISASLELTTIYCFTEVGQSLTFERFIIQCLNLLKKILQSVDYKSVNVKDETTCPLAIKAHTSKQEFFTPEILTEMCTRLVTHYFVLTPADLELWDTDPENFDVDDSNKSWKYNLRPCTESVFLAILHQFKDLLSNVLVELMQRCYQPVDPNDLSSILLKDAVYNAVGLAAFDLYDEVNFDQWFCTTLKLELKERSNNYRIIRRRVCWLLGKWTGVKLSAELRPQLYSLLIESLSPDEDLGVRLAASDALKLAIDDFQFHIDDFVPFLEPAFSSLFGLLKEVKECDTKMRVLYVMSFMTEIVGSGITPYIGALSKYLPDLWQESENHNMLRCAIVSTLVQLEKALGSDCFVLQPLVVGVVELSCDVNQEGHVYLLEDGLDLWLALIENTSTTNPEIMNLAKKLPVLLESSSENLKLSLTIVKAYILLNPQEFLAQHGSAIVESLNSILGDLRSDGIVMVMRLLEVCIRASPQYGTQVIKSILLRIFESVYKKGDYPMVLTMYLSITARVFLVSQDVFIQVIRELTLQLGNDLKEEIVLAQIIHTFVDHMPLVTQHERRKLLSLALCSLLGPNCPMTVLQYFPHMILNIVETLNDITKVSDTGVTTDSLVEDVHNLQLEDVGYETEHSQRKRRLVFNDPVHCIALDKYLQNQLNTLRKDVGEEQFQYMMKSVNEGVDQQLREYIKI